MGWWTVVTGCGGGEKVASGGGANRGESQNHYPPFSWPGGSRVVDWDGRLLAQADPGPGEKIVVAPIDISALRAERERRTGHPMLGHLRTEASPFQRQPIYKAGLGNGPPDLHSN